MNPLLEPITDPEELEALDYTKRMCAHFERCEESVRSGEYGKKCEEVGRRIAAERERRFLDDFFQERRCHVNAESCESHTNC